MNGFPTPEQQYEQCRRWAELLRTAGYKVDFNYTSEPAPFDRRRRRRAHRLDRHRRLRRLLARR